MLKELEEPERKERGTESQKGRGAAPQLPARRRRAMQSGRGQRRRRWASRRPAARSSVSSRASAGRGGAGGEERSLVVTPGRRRLGARGLPRMPPEFWGRPGGREREAAGWSGTPVTTSVQGTRSGGLSVPVPDPPAVPQGGVSGRQCSMGPPCGGARCHSPLLGKKGRSRLGGEQPREATGRPRARALCPPPPPAVPGKDGAGTGRGPSRMHGTWQAVRTARVNP